MSQQRRAGKLGHLDWRWRPASGPAHQRRLSEKIKVFVFDLLAYGEQLEHLKIDSELPYPLPKKYFKPEVAARTYAEHLEAWEELDRLGYDGVGFNEHHCSPYGLMNSPNLLLPPQRSAPSGSSC